MQAGAKIMRIHMRIGHRQYLRFKRCAACLCFCTIILYITLPLIFWSSTFVQGYLIFKNYDVSQDVNFTDPGKENLLGTCNHYLKFGSGIVLGVWQILPIDSVHSSLQYKNPTKAWFLQQLSDGKPIVLYCHGNKPSRATEHRIKLYQILQKLNYHVITFDYRGFADSTVVKPSEIGVVEDTYQMMEWIQSHSTSPLYVWGHSLGTGIATEAVANRCKNKSGCPHALILQAPFTSLEDEMSSITLTWPFRILPWFSAMFITPLTNQGLTLDNKKNIMNVDCPVLILHAEDDMVVPFHLGKKLYEIARRKKKNGSVQFVSFAGKFGYGHNSIYKAPELPSIIRGFLEGIREERNT